MSTGAEKFDSGPDGKSSGKIYAVITGDFIGFSGLDKKVRSSMPDSMARAGCLLGRFVPGAGAKKIDVFRGDSFQALIEDPARALRAALVIRAHMKSDPLCPGLDARMAIGVGQVDYFDSRRVSSGDGSAFRRSGKMLEKMSRARGAGMMRYSFPGAEWEPLADALVRTVGALCAGWSRVRAGAVLGMLMGMKPAEIAESRQPPISRQAVSRQLKNACWPELVHAVEAFEAMHYAIL